MSLEACSGVGSSKGFDFASRPPERDPQSPPPAKRRRLAAAEPEDTDDISDDGSEFDAALGSDWGSLSSPRLSAAGEEAREADDDDLPESRPKPPRYKIYEPKTRTVQEPMFVTQLTQPASSPSRIRGPRWKKPDQQTDRQSSPMQSSPQAQSSSPTPPPFPAEADAGNAQPNDESIYSDDDMRAAIAASLECFREEESFHSLGTVRDDSPAWNLEQNPPLHASALGTANALSADTSFLEDIPDDAFDTSPEVSPQQTVRNPLPSIPQQRHPRPPGSSQQQMRQTTLLGGFARNQVPSSQGVSRTWKLSSQAQSEAPTHHRLDPEALACWVFPANLGRRREYQYNISQRALFHNLLVALPTGLGKTFIAATVMLNWYRWTLDAQIVFVAPTKPLVSQQVGACFNIVGIPKSRTTMLTGEAPPAVREDEWKTKRVFFMTPQTLINDLKTGIADPKRIVLLVVDEAHRATGAYAYTQVIQFLRMFNPSFRVLALTATPGSTVESVQQVIDNLNISRVEIRTESSIDIREYVHSRNVEVQTFENSEEMAKVMGLFAKALQPAVNKLCGLNAFWNKDPMSLTPYGLTQARRQWMGSAAAKHNKAIVGMVNALFTVLASLAHSVDLLKYHGISPFYRSIASFESSAQAGKGKTAQQIADDKNFKEMMLLLRRWTRIPQFIGHPKLEYLKQVVLNHFLDADSGTTQGRGQTAADTRIMIFVHFRDSAEEIVRVLKMHEPIIKPHVFVGQANANGSEGMGQKVQLDIVKKFKAGVYNTIVATSIGEEGLDIGEVDLIVCYDSSSSPIRMLQRMGRTGRKRQGNIVLLLMKGKEEESYIKAKDNYEKMQEMIACGDRFNYHTDTSPRIIPRDIQPYPEEKMIEIPIENTQADLPEPKKPNGRLKKRAPKKFHMPDGVETGFTTASRMGRPKPSPSISDLDEVVNGNLSDEEQKEEEEVGSLSSSDDLASIPPPNHLSLTLSQRADLAEELQSAPEAPVEPPRVDAYPTMQRLPRKTKFVRHGRATRGMVKALGKIAGIGFDCEDEWKEHFRPEDAARFRSSSPEDPPKSRSRRRRDRRMDSDTDASDLFSSPDDLQRRSEVITEECDESDESDIPDPSALFWKLLSTNRESARDPALDEVAEYLDSLDDSTPQPSAPRRNRYVISDDSDSS